MYIIIENRININPHVEVDIRYLSLEGKRKKKDV